MASLSDLATLSIDANAQADRFHADTEASIAELKGVASEGYDSFADSPTISGDTSTPPTWLIDQVREVAVAGLGDLPVDRPSLAIPAFVFNPEDYLASDLLERYSYESDFFDSFLDSRLRDYIDSQTHFLAQEVQDALFQQTRERDLQTLNDALDATDRLQGRKGFPIPTSLHYAARGDVIKRYQDTMADRNKEITALIAERSLQEKMHAIDSAIKMEDIRSRFQLEFGRMYWQAADYLIKKYETDVRAELERFRAEYNLIELKARIDLGMAGFDDAHEAKEHEREAKRLDARLKELQLNFETWKDVTAARIQATAAQVNYYANNVLGYAGQTNLVATNQD